MNVSHSYPRLLLITSNAFNSLSGGGITFTNLFRGWPKDRIAAAHADPTPPTADVCACYYHLGSRELPWMFPFSLANLFHAQDKAQNFLKHAKGSVSKRMSSSPFRRVATQLIGTGIPLIQKIIGDEIPTAAHLSAPLKKWVREFQPQIIYTILGSLPYMRLVRQIVREFNIPFVIHMMDDWPEALYRQGIFSSLQRHAMKKELQEMFDKAAVCLGISPAMCDAYEKRYGRKFLSFHNVLEAKHWLKMARKDWNHTSTFRIVYAGALMPNSQLQSVQDVAEAVAALARQGRDIVFDVYAPWYMAQRYRSGMEVSQFVCVHDIPEGRDSEKLFSEANLLLLPVNFDAATVRYVRYSMPTKIPAYMFSGTPTLAYGPAEVASIQYARQWAHCVIKRSIPELQKAILKLASDEGLRKNLALHAQNLAEERHDAAKVRPAFHKVFEEAVRFLGKCDKIGPF